MSEFDDGVQFGVMHMMRSLHALQIASREPGSPDAAHREFLREIIGALVHRHMLKREGMPSVEDARKLADASLTEYERLRNSGAFT